MAGYSNACRECGSGLRPGARFCAVCGVSAPAVGSRPRVARRRRQVGWPLAGIAVGALVVGAAAATILLPRAETPEADLADSHDPSAQAATPSTRVAGAAEPPVRTPEIAPEEGSVDAVGETIPAGGYVRLGSFRSLDNATREAARLERHGIHAAVVDSNRTTGVLPAFFVTVTGPMAGAAEEQRIARQATEAGIEGTLVGELAPAAPIAPAALGDEYSGSVKQVDANVKRLNRERPVRIFFGASGESATVFYATPRCEAALTFEGEAGAALTYREQARSGPCVDGGSWHFKLEGGELLATWWGPEGTTTFRVGRLRT